MCKQVRQHREHRAAGCRVLVPRQRKFYEDLAVINECLDELIARAKDTRQVNDIEALQSRDYSKVFLPRLRWTLLENISTDI